MIKPRVSHLIHIIRLLGYCILSSIIVFALGAFIAHRTGLERAAIWAFALQVTLHVSPFTLLVYPIILVQKRIDEMYRSEMPNTPVEVGNTIWQHRRFVVTFLGIPALIAVSVDLVHSLMRGDSYLPALFLCIVLTASFIQQWIRPNSERLYVLGTGDTSRINDERAQQVQGKAAISTLNILWYTSLSSGILYEMAVLGTWPVRTGVAILIISVTQRIATRYWNKRL